MKITSILTFLLLLAGVQPAAAQGCGNLNMQHTADIASVCGEMVITMTHDQMGQDYLYVANKEAGLRVYDISNPNTPVSVAQVPTSQLGNLEVMNVEQQGSYLYLALGNTFVSPDSTGMAIVDVSIPSAPMVTDYWIYPDDIGGGGIVKVSGDYAYLGGMRNGLFIFDVSLKSDIQLLSQYVPDLSFPEPNPDTAKYNARGMALDGDVVYLAFDAGGIRVINVADKMNPVETGRYSNPALLGKPRAYNNLVADGDYLYVAVDYCGMEVLDVSDTSNISLAGWWNPWECETNPFNWFSSPGHANEIRYIKECGLLFISTGKSDMHVVDVSDPTQPDSCNIYGGVGNNIGTWGVNVYEDQIYLSYICAAIPFGSNWTGVKILNWDNSCATGVLGSSLPPLEVYPNPASDQVRVNVPASVSPHGGELRLLDLMGRSLREMRLTPGTGQFSLDLSGLQGGLYLLELRVNDMVCSTRLLKQE